MWWCCCDTSCSMRLTITVHGACGESLVSGASVHVTGPGGFDQTNVTDASGVVAFDLTVAGTYSYSVPRTGYTTAVGSTTVLACADKAISVTLVRAGGYFCSTCCFGPITSTIYATGPFGTIAGICCSPTVFCFSAASSNACSAVVGDCFGFPHTFMEIGSATVAVTGEIVCAGSKTLSIGFLSTQGALTGNCFGPNYYAPSPSHCSGSSLVSDGCGGLSSGFLDGYTATLTGTCEKGVMAYSATFPSTYVDGGGATHYFPFPGTWLITN